MTIEGDRIRVLLADDHPVVVDGLARFLSQMGDIAIVGTAPSGGDVERALAETPPDVVVLDLDMPGLDGIATVKAWLGAHPELRIVVFSMHEEDQMAVNLLRAGVFGYLNKARDPHELAEAIRYAHRKRRYLTPELADRMLQAGSRTELLHESFSPREREVFDMLVSGLDTKTIGRRLRIAPSTVHTYADRIKSKLDVASLAELIRYAHEHGLARRRASATSKPRG
jgi:two-component system, NarL family, invasion response regulator UvrY